MPFSSGAIFGDTTTDPKYYFLLTFIEFYPEFYLIEFFWTRLIELWQISTGLAKHNFTYIFLDKNKYKLRF